MGVNIILNGHIYHFEDDASLDELLDQTADRVDETRLENGVLYDDEIPDISNYCCRSGGSHVPDAPAP